MKYKKRIVILLLIIFLLLSVAGVSASDAEDISVQVGIDSSDDVVALDEENSLNLLDNDERVGSASFTDFQEYIDAASPGSEINFYNNHSLSEGGSTIIVAKSITIDGHNCVLDGNKKNTILDISPEAEYVVLKNIEFKNGKKGGAILSSSPSLTLINCKFTSNTADNNGGAVNSAGALSIIDCTFRENNARHDGGAVFNNGTLTITNTRFESNNANQNGGAVFNNGTLIINDNSYFGSNNANQNGGAVNSVGALSIIDSSFRENNAHQNGGAICNYGKITVVNSGFAFNNVRSATQHSVGGAIANWGDCYFNSSSNFDSNYADNEAGAVYCVGNLFCDDCLFKYNGVNYGNGPIAGAIECFGEVHASNSQFIRNYAGHTPSGNLDACMSRFGTIYARGKCYIDSCNFDTNFAIQDGGAIHSCDDLYINGKCSFKNHVKSGTIWAEKDVYINWNTNENDVLCEISGGTIGGDGGAAIHVEGSLYAKHLKVHDNTCINSVNWGGGAIYSHGRTTIYNSEFLSNLIHIDRSGAPFEMRTGHGGAICSDGRCYIESCNFFNNIGEQGGAIYTKRDLTITGQCIFGANYQYEHDIYVAEGGAIFCGGNILVENARFTDNHGIGAGGAIYCIGTCTVRNSEFYRNNATTVSLWDEIMAAKLGGAICSRGTIDIDHCIFTDNTADAGGGAVWAYNEIKVRNSNFTDNVVSGKLIGAVTTEACGGAIFMYSKGSPEIVSCIFDGNQCRFNGGAIFVRSSDTHLTMSDCNLYYNSAYNDGGAIYCNGQTTIYNSEFYQNQAVTFTAGAIRSCDLITVNGCVFQDNGAESSAGAIYADKQIIIKNSNFTGNGAKEVGAVYASTVTQVSNSQFYGNKAYSGNGGAIRIAGACNPEFISCLFEQNSCSGYGGAIYPDSSSTPIKLSGCEFNYNHAGIDGGAVYCKAQTTVVDSKFVCNDAHNRGGAVYANGNIIITDSNFDGNTAKWGGAVYTSTIDQTVSNSVFIKNKATEGDGGAIYLGSASSYLGLDSCTFINNAAKQGGAVYAHQITKVSNSKFYGNNATSDSGGALHVQNDDLGNYDVHSDIISCIFEKNNCPNLGGALYFRSNYAHLKLSDSKFTYNTARQGGAVYVENLDQISKSVFIRNKATGNGEADGGAVYVYNDCKPELVSSRFEENTADNRGGAVFMNGLLSHFKASYCTFVDNHADKRVSGGRAGHTIYAVGYFDSVDMCWFGINNPDFKEQLVEYHTWPRSDEDHIPSNYLNIGIKSNETDFYIGNHYKVTVYLYSNDGRNLEGEVLHSPWRIFLQGGNLIKNETTFKYIAEDVEFTNESSLFIGRLDKQGVTLKSSPKYKKKSVVRILACDDVKFPLQLSASYEILNKADNTIYLIKNSQGETVIQGHLEDSSGYMRINYVGMGTRLNPGSYSLTIINQESRTTLASSANATYNVLANDFNLKITVPDKVYPEEVECTVNTGSFIGLMYNLTVTNDSGVVVSKMVGITQRVGHINIGVLHTGNYTATISYPGGELYNPVSNSTTFEVKRGGTNFKIELNATEITYGETATATPILPAGATGTITYYLDNGTFLGKLAYNEILTLPVLDVGHYVIFANYSGDIDDEPANDTELIIVNPALNNVVVSVDDVIYGNESVIVVSADVDGVYQLDVSGTVYDLIINNGLGNRSVRLDAGLYYANVTFVDRNHITNAKNATFRVNKVLNSVVVSVADVTYGEESVIVILADVDGVYQLDVNGTVYSVAVNDGVGNKSLALNAGNYYANVTFIDNNYITNAENATFAVNRAKNNVVVSVADVTYGEASVIVVSADVDGVYQLDVNGTFYPVFVNDGVGNRPVALNAGNYYANVTFIDNNYITNAENATFAVNRAKNNVVVSVADVTYGEASVIVVSVDVDGVYQLDVNGTVYDLIINNGLGNRSVRLDAGLYYANVTFVDRNHITNAENATFRVNKVLNSVVVSVADVTYGEASVIVVSADVDGVYQLDVNGTVYSVAVNGSVGNKSIALNAGNYYVNATFDDENYDTVAKNTTFRVNKADIDLIVVVLDEVYHQDVEATVYSSRDGIYDLNVAGYSTVVTVKDNIGYFNAGILDAGIYEAIVSFEGDDNYNSAKNTTSFTVHSVGILFEIDINPSTITYGETSIVTHIVNDTATGKVSYYLINGTFLGELSLDEYFTLPVFDAGYYVIVANYSGDGNFESASDNAFLVVNPVLNNVDVSVDDVTYGNESVIVVSAEVDGEYQVGINGTVYSVFVNDGVGNRSVALDAGDYYANVTFDNGNYDTVAKNATFRVNKADIVLMIYVFDVVYPYEVEGIVYAIADGEYNLTIADYSKVIDIKNNFAYFNAGVFDAGSYEANLSFAGNGNYNSGFNNTTFIVKASRTPFVVEIYPSEIVYGENVTVVHVLPDEATGNISYYLSNGTFLGKLPFNENLTLSVWDVGSYVIIANYSGDGNFDPASDNAVFVVGPALNNVVVSVDDVIYGNESVIVVSADVDGVYQLDVNGTVYNLTVDGGLGNRSVCLDAGLYYANVTFIDNNYITNAENATFAVNRAKNSVVVSVADVIYGNESVIVVSADVDGVYQLDVNGTVYSVFVNDGVGNKSIALNAGNYYANVTFVDRNYVTVAKNATFRVNRALNSVVVSVADVTYGEESVIVVSADVDGVYQLDVNGTVYNLTVDGGLGNRSVCLDAGLYYANVTFIDNNYITNAENATFTVNRAKNNVVVSVADVTYGEESFIVVSGDVDGEYKVDVNGTVYTVSVDGGVGVKPITLDAGDYYANVTFDNSNYATNAENATFSVYRADVSLSVEAYSVVYPQDVVVTVYANLDGRYNLTIGEYSIMITVENGYYELDAGVFDVGDYMIVVTYPGDLNHNSNSSSVNITVSKYTPDIGLKVSDINYGDIGVITITSDVPGSVNVTVNGITETLDLNGQSKDVLFAAFSSILRADYSATLNAHNLNAGSYPVTVVYNGDGNIESVKLTGEFNVNAVNVTMDIDSSDVSVGEDEKITVSLPSSATGKVTVTVDGKSYVAPVRNGKAVITIPGLTAGSKNAVVYYSGDANHNPAVGNVSFEVKKLKPKMSADTNSPVSGEKAHIVVNLPDDATGTVTITVDGKNYTSQVKNGKAIFNIPDLAAGKYNVIAYYSGDDKYDAAQIELMLTVKDKGTKHEIHSDKSSPSEEIVASGNPILVLLFALMTIGFTGIRRFKK